jgi:hypothetical protein
MFGNLKERDKRIQQPPAPLQLARGGQAEVGLGRSVVEMSIEKYEKTAMQWLEEKTQNN